MEIPQGRPSAAAGGRSTEDEPTPVMLRRRAATLASHWDVGSSPSCPPLIQVPASVSGKVVEDSPRPGAPVLTGQTWMKRLAFDWPNPDSQTLEE